MSTEPNYFADVPWHNAAGDGRVSPPMVPDLPGWLRELYPFRTRTFFLANERISLLDEGDPAAPPLLMLHDSPGWSFSFRRLIPALSAHYRVIAPDLVGFGLSSKPARADSYDLSCHASDITELVEALELRDLVLLLHGWGGPIGMAYAVRHPSNIRRLLLANTWAMPLPHATNIRFPWGVRLALSGRIGRKLDSVLRLSVTSGVEAAPSPLPGLVLEGYKYPYEHGASTDAVRCFWEKLRRPHEATVKFLADVAAGLPNITAPTDIVWGRKDHLLQNITAHLLRARLPSAKEITFLEEAGHNVPEDAPEALLAKLLAGPVEAPKP